VPAAALQYYHCVDLNHPQRHCNVVTAQLHTCAAALQHYNCVDLNQTQWHWNIITAPCTCNSTANYHCVDLKSKPTALQHYHCSVRVDLSHLQWHCNVITAQLHMSATALQHYHCVDLNHLQLHCNVITAQHHVSATRCEREIDRMVRPPLFQDHISNCTNLFRPELNRTRHRIFTFVSLLFGNL